MASIKLKPTRTITCFVGLALVLAALQSGAAGPDHDSTVLLAQASGISPKETILEYYGAVGRGDCETALRIRPGYPESNCRRISEPKVKERTTEEKYNHGGHAVVLLDLAYLKDGEQNFYSGFVALTRHGNRWIIVNHSYKSSMDLDEYIEKVVKRLPSPDRAAADTGRPGKTTWPTAEAGPSFGSESILKACFSSTDLKGRLDDRKLIRPDPNAFKYPPDRVRASRRRPPLSPQLKGSIRKVRVGGGMKVVALTFDVCQLANEKTGYDSNIVNFLRQNKIKATFYISGKWMLSHPDKTKQLIADPLFEIGGHGWDHANMREITGVAMRNQVEWTQGQYELLWEQVADSACAKSKGASEMDKIPRIPYTFRFPHGVCSPESLEHLAEAGLPAVQWSLFTRDARKTQTAKAIVDLVKNTIYPGDIIIMHANGQGRYGYEALKNFVPALRKKGYSFVTVTELLSLGEPEVAGECYETMTGDNAIIQNPYGE